MGPDGMSRRTKWGKVGEKDGFRVELWVWGPKKGVKQDVKWEKGASSCKRPLPSAPRCPHRQPDAHLSMACRFASSNLLHCIIESVKLVMFLQLGTSTFHPLYPQKIKQSIRQWFNPHFEESRRRSLNLDYPVTSPSLLIPTNLKTARQTNNIF